MSSPTDVLDIIRSYLERYQHSQAPYSQLLSFLDRYILENPENGLDDLRRNGHTVLSAHLDALEKSEDIRIIRKDNSPISVVYPAFFVKKIHAVYDRADEKPELPYPNDDSIGLDIPPEDVVGVDIKSDFMVWLGREGGQAKILRIGFPEGIASMITTSEILKTKTLTNAVHKIRHYLRDSKNMSYTRQKLTPLLRTRELAVKDMLHSIVTTPDSSAQTILEPSDFTFHLWTQLSTNIIKEYGPKADKMAEEHGFCQAAYLIGYYNVYFRGVIQKRKESEAAMSYMMQTLRRPPYVFRISEIHEFKDDKGILLTKRLDKDLINKYIEVRLAPDPDRDVPEFLKVKGAKNDEFFMLYTSVQPFISEALIRAQKEMREFYSRSWMISLKQDIEFATMYSDDEFRAHIDQRLAAHYPQLRAVLSYEVVFFGSRVDGLSETQRLELIELLNINTQKLKPLDVILRVNRKKLYDDARMMLPAWMVIPVLRVLVRGIRNLFLGKTYANTPYAEIFDHESQKRVVKKTNAPPEKTGGEAEGKSDRARAKISTAKQDALRRREAAKSLEQDFLPPGSKLAPTLESLIDRWNNVLDPTAKKNLTEDVNSLVRDFLRRTKVMSKPKLPTSDDIKAYANKVWEVESLSKIRARKELLRYLELYIIQLLETA